MKKILALLLVAVMCLYLVACSSGVNESTQPQSDSEKNNVINSTTKNTESDFANHPLLAKLFGTWELQSDEDIAYNPYSCLTVNEDGTCFIDDKAGTWNICNKQTTEDDLFIDLYCNNEKVASACLFGNTMSISAFDAYGAMRPGNWTNTAVFSISENVIVLTTDNWRDYFELVTEPTYKKDVFGDTERLELVQYIALKEEYANNVAYIDDVVVELKSTASRYYITLDATNDSYTLGDIVEEIELSEEVRELSIYDGIYKIAIENNYINADDNADPNSENSKCVILVNDINDIEFLRIKGTIYVNNQ